MAMMLTPLLRKLPCLSSTKLMLRYKCESIVQSFNTTENGCRSEKEYKPEKISGANKDCNVDKDCNCVPQQNSITTSSTLGSNYEPVVDDKGSETQGAASTEAKDMPQCKCLQCHETPSMESQPLGKPSKWTSPPEVPTNCCMTGCPNCVWLKFAEDMMEFSAEGGASARKIIEEIEDPNLRTFLLLELDNLQKT